MDEATYREVAARVTESTMAGGPGGSFVPTWGIVVLVSVVAAFSVLVLFSLWAVWPAAPGGDSPTRSGGAQPQQNVTLLGAQFALSREASFFLVVAIAGSLGGLIHTIRSLS